MDSKKILAKTIHIIIYSIKLRGLKAANFVSLYNIPTKV